MKSTTDRPKNANSIFKLSMPPPDTTGIGRYDRIYYHVQECGAYPRRRECETQENGVRAWVGLGIDNAELYAVAEFSDGNESWSLACKATGEDTDDFAWELEWRPWS